MAQPVLVPGRRDVRGTLVRASNTPDAVENSVLVACPPHPKDGGGRHDRRLRVISDAITAEGIDCLRIDYGEWAGGDGERTDVGNAIRWAADRYEHVGVVGYSFGGAIALLATADCDRPLTGVAALAPAAHVGDDLDAVAALADVDVPVLVLYGARDTAVNWQPIVERAQNAEHEVTEIVTDHYFIGKQDHLADATAGFFTTLVQ